MDTSQLLETLRSILGQPTAPFHEDAVRAEICQQLAQCPHVTLEIDEFQNLIATYANGDAPARYAFAAHMDHPGFVGGEFHGGVPKEYLDRKPPTRDYGAFAMWDLPAFTLEHSRIYSRACDDLIGCAMALASLGQHADPRVAAHVRERGAKLNPALESLSIGKVRGLGLMLGIELVKANGEPDGERAIAIVKAALRAGLLLLADGPASNVLSFAPPFAIDDAEIAFVAGHLAGK